MKALVETLAFTSLAAAVHAAVLVGFADDTGLPEGAGDAGDAVLSLQAAAPAVTRAVALWSTPPDTAQDVPKRAVAPSLPTPLALARPADAYVPNRAALPEGLNATPQAPSAPEMFTDAPAPQSGKAPERPVQVATGAGDAGQHGAAVARAQTSQTRTQTASLMAAWGGEIRARIEARKAKPRGLWADGRAIVRITVSEDGKLRAANVIRSSGDARLDNAALVAVKRAGRLPAAPKGMGLAQASFDLPISFTR